MTKRFWLVVLLAVVLAVTVGCARDGSEDADSGGAESEPQENRVVTEQSEELADAASDEQRERMEEIVAAYPGDQLQPERGECNVCHVGSEPWQQGDDLAGLVSSMVDGHTQALDPQLNAEVNAYFLQMVEERQ